MRDCIQRNSLLITTTRAIWMVNYQIWLLIITDLRPGIYLLITSVVVLFL